MEVRRKEIGHTRQAWPSSSTFHCVCLAHPLPFAPVYKSAGFLSPWTCFCYKPENPDPTHVYKERSSPLTLYVVPCLLQTLYFASTTVLISSYTPRCVSFQPFAPSSASSKVLERLRPTRETAGDFIADARTELQQQRHKLQSIHSRLAEQLDRLQDGKSDVWQPRADAVHEAEIMASDIIGRAGNAACADCGAPATYARADLGLTLCARCAAQHKALLMERGGSETAGGELISATSAAAAVTSVATPTSAFVEAAAAALAAAPLGETPPQALLLALDAPPRLVPLPGLAVVSKATRSDLWPLAADLAFVRALGNTAANDVFEHALRGSGKARSFKPAPDGSDAERATYIRSKYIARQFVSPEGVSRSLVEAAAAGDMPSLLHHVFVNRSRQLEDKVCLQGEKGMGGTGGNDKCVRE